MDAKQKQRILEDWTLVSAKPSIFDYRCAIARKPKEVHVKKSIKKSMMQIVCLIAAILLIFTGCYVALRTDWKANSVYVEIFQIYFSLIIAGALIPEFAKKKYIGLKIRITHRNGTIEKFAIKLQSHNGASWENYKCPDQQD